MNSQSENTQRYNDVVARLRSRYGDDAAFEAAVGGEFFTVGYLEFALLRSLGLGAADTVVDVGCGSGRLATQLVVFPEIKYVGTDVVPVLLDQARKITGMERWRFALTDGPVIPEPDGTADFVCFFSVLTHLSHEDSYRYLREAKRVLRPGGKIVVSFLEFRIDSHWLWFQYSVDLGPAGAHHNQYIERTALEAWARHLDLRLDAVHDGDKPHIPIDRDLRWSDGRMSVGTGALGQSVAVFSKP
jgi:SAM-dependent methyltransferase